MNSNFQGRKRGKSVSFRGQSNDSNFYEHRPRNDNNFYDGKPRNSFRDSYNNEDNNSFHHIDDDLRTVTLLPDANMTISVKNDFRGSNRGRARGRGILKSQSFRDDTNIHNRSADFYYRSGDDDQNNSKRGFETHPYQGNRYRGRNKGFYNRTPPYMHKNQDDNFETEKDRDVDGYHDDGNFAYRGRGRPSGNRRFRGGRGRGGRGRSVSNRHSDEHNEGPTSGDGDKDDSKDNTDNVEHENSSKVNENEECESHIPSENLENNLHIDEYVSSEDPQQTEVKEEAALKSDTNVVNETDVVKETDDKLAEEDCNKPPGEDSVEQTEQTEQTGHQ